jgi:HlyD family secretion protein
MVLPIRGLRPRPLSLALIAPLLLVACATTPAGQAPIAPATVVTAPATTGSISGTVVYSGNAESLWKVNVLPRVSGQITVLNVDVGSAVKKGQVIAEIDHAMQDAQIAQAQAGVDAAKAKLATVQAGPRQENVEQAKANLAAAQQNLTFMQNGGRPENVAAAQGAVTSAAAKLTSLKQGNADLVAQATANVQAAQSKLQQLKDGPTQQQVHAATVAVQQAKNGLFAAQSSRDGTCGNKLNPGYLCESANAAVDAAQTGIDQATAQLQILTTPPTVDQLNQAQAAINAAQAQLNQAQHPGSASDINAAAGAVQAAQAQLDLAKAPYSSADLAKAQAAVDVADQQLKLAEAPYTQQDTDAAKAALEQAQAALSVTQVARDQAIITSPIDGVVAQKLTTLGSVASPATPIVVLIDPGVDVLVNADATQASALHAGDAATITSDALPGKAILGKVTSIAPAVDPQARTIQVKVTPDSQDSGLKDGMLAQVTLVTATHNGVIVIPATAIVQRNGQPTVYVVANGVAKPQAVQTGLSDGSKTEITNGFQSGQLIVVGGQDRLTTAQPVQIQKSGGSR